MRRRTWAPAAAAVLLVAIAAVLVVSGGKRSTSVAQAAPASTAKVQEGELSAMLSQDGTLTYEARKDGSPFAAINHARGTYTELPEVGDEVGCGGVLYRVDDEPVLLLCGAVPAYRTLRVGDTGRDVRQLNRNLRVRGAAFTTRTETALEALQRRRGVHVDGSLARSDAVFLPAAVRIAKVTGQLGGAARPGAQVLSATSGTLHVRVNLAPSDQGQVERGDRARITLPGNQPVSGRVEGFGRVAQTAPDGKPADASVPTYVGLDRPAKAHGLDRAPVAVDITTKGVPRALSVPVTALAGRSGGGFAVEVVRTGGRRELVAVRLGLFDTGGGRVQVEGDLRAGDDVVVPSL